MARKLFASCLVLVGLTMTSTSAYAQARIKPQTQAQRPVVHAAPRTSVPAARSNRTTAAVRRPPISRSFVPQTMPQNVQNRSAAHVSRKAAPARATVYNNSARVVNKVNPKSHAPNQIMPYSRTVPKPIRSTPGQTNTTSNRIAIQNYPNVIPSSPAPNQITLTNRVPANRVRSKPRQTNTTPNEITIYNMAGNTAPPNHDIVVGPMPKQVFSGNSSRKLDRSAGKPTKPSKPLGVQNQYPSGVPYPTPYRQIPQFQLVPVPVVVSQPRPTPVFSRPQTVRNVAPSFLMPNLPRIERATPALTSHSIPKNNRPPMSLGFNLLPSDFNLTKPSASAGDPIAEEGQNKLEEIDSIMGGPTDETDDAFNKLENGEPLDPDFVPGLINKVELIAAAQQQDAINKLEELKKGPAGSDPATATLIDNVTNDMKSGIIPPADLAEKIAKSMGAASKTPAEIAAAKDVANAAEASMASSKDLLNQLPKLVQLGKDAEKLAAAGAALKGSMAAASALAGTGDSGAGAVGGAVGNNGLGSGGVIPVDPGFGGLAVADPGTMVGGIPFPSTGGSIPAPSIPGVVTGASAPPSVVSVPEPPAVPAVPDMSMEGGLAVPEAGSSPLSVTSSDSPEAANAPADIQQPMSESATDSKTVSDCILIRNPIQNGAAVSYVIDDKWTYTLEPGCSQQLDRALSHGIRFNRGGNNDNAAYKLCEGTYNFVVAEKGWDLARQEFSLTVNNSKGKQNFTYAIDNQPSNVTAGSTRVHKSNFPIVVRFNRGEEGKDAVKRVTQFDAHLYVAIDPADGLWDLKPSGTRSRNRATLANEPPISTVGQLP